MEEMQRYLYQLFLCFTCNLKRIRIGQPLPVSNLGVKAFERLRLVDPATWMASAAPWRQQTVYHQKILCAAADKNRTQTRMLQTEA